MGYCYGNVQRVWDKLTTTRTQEILRQDRNVLEHCEDMFPRYYMHDDVITI